jgi:hypothetical protein
MVQSKLNALTAVALFPQAVKEQGEFISIDSTQIIFKCRKHGSNRILVRYIPINRVISFEINEDKKGTLTYEDIQGEISYKGFVMSPSKKGDNEPSYPNFVRLASEDKKPATNLFIKNTYFLGVHESQAGENNSDKKKKDKPEKKSDKKDKTEKTEKVRRKI